MYKDLHNIDTQLESERWIVTARWYYATLAFLLGLIGNDDMASGKTLVVLLVALAVVLLFNTFFYLYLHSTTVGRTPRGRLILSISQIGVDLIYFFAILLTIGGGVHGIGQSFFFIPIIVSIVILGFRGAIIVGSLSGLFVLLSVLAGEGILQQFLAGGEIHTTAKELSLELAETAIIFTIYLLAGFFGGYVSQMIRMRDKMLLEEISSGESHVKQLEELTREFDQSAKLLVRRDIELSSANEKLVQLDKMKSEIISVVTHQLRTPLSAIKWTLKMLLDGDLGTINEEQKGLIKKGFDSNERMILLVNDMLAVDRLDSGRNKYSFVPIQFEGLIQELVGELLPIATQRNIRVEFLAPKESLPKIKVDPDKMRDVLQNLIDNAIKYTRQGGLVSIGVALENNELHFWVKDNGIGIPEEDKGKIFSRFFRAANAVHTETDGSGLGLFIVQSVIRRHGGRIWFDSVIDEGTTFHVTLPFTP